MDYPLIETFIVVSEVRNLTQASQILYKTQPTISNRIRQLENILGYSLIVRDKGYKEITLTERGQQFLPQARKLYDAYQEMQNDNDMIAHTLLISSIASYQIPLVHRTCEKLLSRTSANFSIYTYQTSDVYNMISNKKLDLALVSAAHKVQGVTCEFLLNQKYYVVMPSNSNTDISSISTTDLDPAKEIYQPWDDEFFYWHEKVFHGKKARIIADSYALLREFFKSGKYWAILQESNAYALRQEIPLQIYRLLDPPPLRQGYLLMNRFTDRSIRNLIAEFKATLIETVEEYRIE